MPDATRDVLDGGSLPALLAERARQASDRRLAVEAATGVLLSVAALVFRPPLWIPLAALAAGLAAFGIWGILDRELREASDGAPHAALRSGRLVVSVIGAACGIIGALALFFASLGMWKS